MIVDSYDWHEGVSSVACFPASAEVLFNDHSDFADVLACLDSVDADTRSKIMGPVRTYFSKARYDHSSAWDTLIHRLEGAGPARTDHLLGRLHNVLLSAREHFQGYVVDVPLHPPDMPLEERAEFYRNAYDEIEKEWDRIEGELDEMERKKGTFAESPERAVIRLKTVTPVVHLLRVEGEGSKATRTPPSLCSGRWRDGC